MIKTITKQKVASRTAVTIALILFGAAALAVVMTYSGVPYYGSNNQATNQANQGSRCASVTDEKVYELRVTFNSPGSYKIEISKDGIYLIEGGNGYQYAEVSPDGSKFIIHFSVPAGTAIPTSGRKLLVAKLYYCSKDYIAFMPTVTKTR